MRDAAGYLPIAGYAAIGNGHTMALVGRDGAIDWCCLPRFDSPFVLDAILDAENGGRFVVAPRDVVAIDRSYRAHTNVLDTVFRTGTGVVRLTDFMPIARARIIRCVEVLDGTVTIDVRIAGSIAQASGSAATLDREGTHLGLAGDSVSLQLRAPTPWHPERDGWSSRCELEAGARSSWMLGLADGATDPDDAELLASTLAHWRAWSSRWTPHGPHAAAIERSALVLSMLVYEPSGALVAAPTTSLPESIGGERNWDYRYTWLRDAAWALDAFMDLGLHDEAMRFWSFVTRASESSPLGVLYTLDGASPAGERTLDGLAGYRGSRPVRVGNAAAQQLQLDGVGHVMEAAYLCQTRMSAVHPQLQPMLAALADAAADRWMLPDHGIWEVRGEPRQFLHSKLMCWVALDRAVLLAERGWLGGDVGRWRAARESVASLVVDGGWNPRLGAFTQALGDDAVDATGLLVGGVGLLPGNDPRVCSTIDVVCRQLARGELVFRYRNADGLRGAEGAFVACSFWLVEALARAGRRDEARSIFAALVARANDVGLYAEEIDPETGEFLGNFPQAFSHLALVRAAMVLDPPPAGHGDDAPRLRSGSSQTALSQPQTPAVSASAADGPQVPGSYACRGVTDPSTG